MSSIERIIVELIENHISDYDFSRIIENGISENDDIISHDSRIDDLENIDVESTLSEFGDRLDDFGSSTDIATAQIAELQNRFKSLEEDCQSLLDQLDPKITAATDPKIKPVLVRALDRVLPSTDPENSIVRGYDNYSDLEGYARAVIREGRDSAAAMLVAMAFATARNMIDSAAAIGRGRGVDHIAIGRERHCS